MLQKKKGLAPGRLLVLFSSFLLVCGIKSGGGGGGEGSARGIDRIVRQKKSGGRDGSGFAIDQSTPFSFSFAMVTTAHEKSLLGFLASPLFSSLLSSCIYLFCIFIVLSLSISRFLFGRANEKRHETRETQNPSINIIPLTLQRTRAERNGAERNEALDWKQNTSVGFGVGGQSDCCREQELTRKRNEREEDKTNH